MLILSRKVGEKVEIKLPDGRSVMVLVSRLNDHQVRLGFQAPRDITIMRSELVSKQEFSHGSARMKHG